MGPKPIIFERIDEDTISDAKLILVGRNARKDQGMDP
jgi:hypothetical protein